MIASGSFGCRRGCPTAVAQTDRAPGWCLELSLGRTFAIADITSHGLLELEVGEVVGVASYLHSIWIEPDCVEPAEAPAEGDASPRLALLSAFSRAVGLAFIPAVSAGTAPISRKAAPEGTCTG